MNHHTANPFSESRESSLIAPQAPNRIPHYLWRKSPPQALEQTMSVFQAQLLLEGFDTGGPWVPEYSWHVVFGSEFAASTSKALFVLCWKAPEEPGKDTFGRQVVHDWGAETLARSWLWTVKSLLSNMHWSPKFPTKLNIPYLYGTSFLSRCAFSAHFRFLLVVSSSQSLLCRFYCNIYCRRSHAKMKNQFLPG